MVIDENNLNRLFEYVNALSHNDVIDYRRVKELMGWEQLDREDHFDRARLNELLNQTKARVNAMARKGKDTCLAEFAPFQLVVSVPGDSWRKIADFDYTENVIDNGVKRVTNAMGAMRDRTVWANHYLDASDAQRGLMKHVIGQLEIEKKQLKEKLDYISSSLKEMRSMQARLDFDGVNKEAA